MHTITGITPSVDVCNAFVSVILVYNLHVIVIRDPERVTTGKTNDYLIPYCAR